MRGSPLQLGNLIILETHDIGYYDIGFLLIGTYFDIHRYLDYM